VSEYLIIEFEKDRENVSEWQNVEFRNYTKSGFPIAWKTVWKKISTPQNTGDQLSRFESNLILGNFMKTFWAISNDTRFIESLTTTIFWIVVRRIFAHGYQCSGKNVGTSYGVSCQNIRS
jgi:hypothetical protein